MQLDWRHLVWGAALLAASVALSLGLACAVPLAAFAACAALTLRRRQAVVLILMICVANQAVGFAFLHYPLAGLVWAAAFALIGVAGVFAAEWTFRSTALAHPMVSAAGAFLAAFVAYEGGLFLITLVAARSELAAYAAPVVLRILAINAITFLGLVLVARLSAGVLGLRSGMRQRAV